MTGDDRDSARSGAAGSGHDRSAFEKEFAFYASYHTESRNQAVHFVFVPQIYWSFLVVLLAVFGDLSASLPPMALKVLTADGALGAFSGATIVVWVYTLWYQRLHTVLGLVVTSWLVVLLLGANAFVAYAGATNAWQIAAVVHIVAWIAQFVAHAKFEGRAPALLDNLLDSLLMAPLFITTEAVMKLGFMKGFKRRVLNDVAKRVSEWKRSEREAAKSK